MKQSLLINLVLLVFFVSLKIDAQIPSYVPVDGLVGWWPLDGNADDLSGNNLNGVFTNVEPAENRYLEENKALYFNGINSFVRIPNNSLFNFTTAQNFTWSVWVSPSDNVSNSPEAGIITKWNEQLSQGYPYTIRLTDQNNGYSRVTTGNYFAGAGTGSANFSVGDLLHGHYVHIVLRVENGLSELFIAGELVSSVPFNNGTVTNSFDLYFGKRHLHQTRWYKGSLDDIGLWDRALSNAEIEALCLASPVSISENYSKGLITIYPNPTSDYFFIQADNSLLGELYMLFDSSGKLLIEGQINSENCIIDLRGFSCGTFVLNVGVEKRIYKVLKL